MDKEKIALDFIKVYKRYRNKEQKQVVKNRAQENHRKGRISRLDKITPDS